MRIYGAITRNIFFSAHRLQNVRVQMGTQRPLRVLLVAVGGCGRTGCYRQVQARLRENAEPIAFYGGIEKEGAVVRGRFSELMRHRMRMLRTQLRHSVVQVWLALWLQCSPLSPTRGTMARCIHRCERSHWAIGQSLPISFECMVCAGDLTPVWL